MDDKSLTGTYPRPKAGRTLTRRLPQLVSLWREMTGLPPVGPGAPDGASGRLQAREIDLAGGALLELQRGLTGERGLVGASYMERQDLLGAYLLYYWPVSYLQVSLALAQIPSLRGKAPRRILDIGSGPGPAAAVLADRGAEELVLVDGSPRALELALRILAGAGRSRPAEGARGPRIETMALDLERDPLPGAEYDLIVISHCINELWKDRSDSDPSRLGLLEAAIGLLSEDGLLLVVEPALLATSRRSLALRNGLLERGHRILGPCPGSWPCPALAAGPERTCHDESPWIPDEPMASLAMRAGLDRRSVKYSWFAAGRQDPAWRMRDRPGPGPGQATTVLHGRIDSDPMLNKAGRLRYILCHDGFLSTLSAHKDDKSARDKGFFELRRGDLVSIEGAELRAQGNLGLGPGTSLAVIELSPEP